MLARLAMIARWRPVRNLGDVVCLKRDTVIESLNLLQELANSLRVDP